MPDIKESNAFGPRTYAWIVIAAFIAANIALALFRLMNRQFNPDEFQHLHIAWLIANGEIIYRDFWEHHGPLYALFNGVMIYLTGAEPSLRIMFAARLLSLIFMSGIGIMIWHMARILSASKTGAWLAVAAYASLFMVQNKGIEMRPDIVQTVFWIAGLLILLRNQSNGSFNQAAVAGAMFALSILSNAKAGIGPFFAVAFYCIAHWLCNMPWADIRRDLLGMILGGIAAGIPILIYFWSNGAAIDFLYFNYVWNVEFITRYSSEFAAIPTDYDTSLRHAEFLFFLKDQLPFLLLSIAGAGFWLRQLFAEQSQVDKQRRWLFTIATVGTTLGWLTNQHSQYFLIFLPLLSILCAYALTEVAALFEEKDHTTGTIVAGSLATLAAAGMLWHAVSSTPFKQSDLLGTQKWFTNKMLRITERDEPLAVLWNNCGGYMFNPNVGYYWVAMPAHSEIIEVISGKHPFREGFIAEMEERQIRYVVGMESWLTEGLSDEALSYIRENFDNKNCLWTRKDL